MSSFSRTLTIASRDFRNGNKSKHPDTITIKVPKHISENRVLRAIETRHKRVLKIFKDYQESAKTERDKRMEHLREIAEDDSSRMSAALTRDDLEDEVF